MHLSCCARYLECAHFIILLCSTCAHYTMEGANKNDIKQLTILSEFSFYIYNWVRPSGITIPSPYLCSIISALCTHMPQNFQKSSKRCGYFSRIASSCSQVASSGLYQVHWTFTIPMDRFRSCLIFQSRMRTGCTWKVPSCST
jgi:hypothetical protein